MRYLAFAGYNYYPCGGMKDCIGSFETLKLAQTALKKAKRDNQYDWFECYDTETGKQVF